MWINPQTLQVFSSHSEIRSAFANVSFPSVMSEDDIAFVGLLSVTPSQQPQFNALTHTVIEAAPAQIDGIWTQQWSVVELTPEQIAINQEKKQKDEAEAVQNKIEALWVAADKYTSSYISGVAIGILTIGVVQQKPKALAIASWSSAIWEEYYTRKSLITLTSQDNHDFSSFGPIPYSVPELQEDAGL